MERQRHPQRIHHHRRRRRRAGDAEACWPAADTLVAPSLCRPVLPPMVIGKKCYYRHAEVDRTPEGNRMALATEVGRPLPSQLRTSTRTRCSARLVLRFGIATPIFR